MREVFRGEAVQRFGVNFDQTRFQPATETADEDAENDAGVEVGGGLYLFYSVGVVREEAWRVELV